MTAAVVGGGNNGILLHLQAATPETECLTGHLADEVWVYGGPSGHKVDNTNGSLQ